MRLSLALCLAVFATHAQAQTMPCGPRAQVLDMLAQAEQTRRAVGHAGRAVMDTFASETRAHTARDRRYHLSCFLPEGAAVCLCWPIHPAPRIFTQRARASGGAAVSCLGHGPFGVFDRLANAHRAARRAG